MLIISEIMATRGKPWAPHPDSAAPENGLFPHDPLCSEGRSDRRKQPVLFTCRRYFGAAYRTWRIAPFIPRACRTTPDTITLTTQIRHLLLGPRKRTIGSIWSVWIAHSQPPSFSPPLFGLIFDGTRPVFQRNRLHSNGFAHYLGLIFMNL